MMGGVKSGNNFCNIEIKTTKPVFILVILTVGRFLKTVGVAVGGVAYGERHHVSLLHRTRSPGSV